jgi:LacI family transcriptional regulator, galactose operon repressor
MTTIVDVAKVAGVSISTVSRVLSSSDHPVSEETRQRVLHAVASLNYSPSALARAMITQDTRIIGIIVSDNQDPFFAAIVRGVEDVARSLGFLVIICNSDRRPDIELKYIQTLNDYRVDGIIFTGGGVKDPAYVAELTNLLGILERRNCAVVSLGYQVFPCVQVSNDNVQATADATRYLAQLGHERIGYISGPEHLTTTGLRLEGYRLGMQQSGLAFNPALVLPGDYTLEAGQKASELIIAMRRRPTAVLASTDYMAIGCAIGLKAVHLSIPEDISVMGINDIRAASCLDPPLSTVSLHMYEMGAVGIRYLLKRRNGEIGDTYRHTIKHELVIRGSTAPPGSGNKE